MYYTIYETTCITNGKKYIGKHITNDIDDAYLGSGMLLKYAIKKYGKKSFVKKVLFIFDNEDAMNQKEKELINEDIVNSNDYYNVAYGGHGGAIVLKKGHILYEEVCQKISKSAIERSESISKTVKELHAQKRCGMHGKKQTSRQKELVSAALKGRKKSLEHVNNHKESLFKTLNDPNYVHPNKGKPKPRKECEHCKKSIDAGNYKRYHGDKCKNKHEDAND